ncbi:unnamed protein product [Rodentolepis nana]|uniref:Uncharacterized protein n=1 Tax=Rodentolepis nana TaxID=102285 RepID=A0A0R3TQD6_RODNA|nr:unnamed protein product [Rodentolepis nana]
MMNPNNPVAPLSGVNGKKKHKRSLSLTACFPVRKTFRQWGREDLLARIQRNTNRRCFTLPPRTSPIMDVIDHVDDNISVPSVSAAIASETDQHLTRRSWNLPIRMPRGTLKRPRKQAETNQSFLRGARSGNIQKVTEYLNSDVDINAVSSVS